MNIYVVVEGQTATKNIYKNWIPLVNANLSHINYPQDAKQDNFFILAGLGQPFFLTRIENAIKDVNRLKLFDRLVIAVDSEDAELREKELEMSGLVDKIGCGVEVKYVIQHFCLETWLLGNIQMFRKKPHDAELKNYITLFDVRKNDPELLPKDINQSLNRAQFSYRYLRAGLRDVYGREWYSKEHAGLVIRETYFDQVRKRCLDKQHILSFQKFLEAFI